jgi:hypothetical protein
MKKTKEKKQRLAFSFCVVWDLLLLSGSLVGTLFLD